MRRNTENLQALKPYIRRLNSYDEAQFIKLLTSVYGQSYSYQDLYEQGVHSSLLQNGKLISYGEFSPEHQLVSHSGFWVKEPNSDYVESGVSFRLPHTSVTTSPSVTAEEWQKTFKLLADKYSFIHQHCSTWHTLAQRYAKKYMQAKECGVIFNYVENETIRGIETHSNRMHSLIMTTVLNSFIYPVKTVYVPQDLSDWIQAAYTRLGLLTQVVPAQKKTVDNDCFSLELLEENTSIQLQRRRVISKREKGLTEIPLSQCKTDLIHVPMHSESIMSQLYPLLIQKGYFPCGIRPHIHQADELIFQQIKSYKPQLEEWLLEMKIACKLTKEWIAEWQTLVQQIL